MQEYNEGQMREYIHVIVAGCDLHPCIHVIASMLLLLVVICSQNKLIAVCNSYSCMHAHTVKPLDVPDQSAKCVPILETCFMRAYFWLLSRTRK